MSAQFAIPNALLLTLFIVSIGLFFWGIAKAVRTQEKKYAWALLPFIVLLLIMFFI